MVNISFSYEVKLFKKISIHSIPLNNQVNSAFSNIHLEIFLLQTCLLILTIYPISLSHNLSILLLNTAVNPRYILRNWMAQEAIQRAEDGDYSKLHLLQTVLKTPYKVHEEAERALFAHRPPQWASKIRVSCSS